MADYYDRLGNHLSLMEWARRLENRRYATVALTRLGDVVVSTVWLGINHNWSEGPPIIFETMVFGGKHDQEQYRYTTESMAMSGHQAVVAEIMKESQDDESS